VVELPFAADRFPCVEKQRTVLPSTVGIRDGAVHLVSTLGSAVISARALTKGGVCYCVSAVDAPKIQKPALKPSVLGLNVNAPAFTMSFGSSSSAAAASPGLPATPAPAAAATNLPTSPWSMSPLHDALPDPVAETPLRPGESAR
jgi:hypothetical protein